MPRWRIRDIIIRKRVRKIKRRIKNRRISYKKHRAIKTYKIAEDALLGFYRDVSGTTFFEKFFKTIHLAEKKNISINLNVSQLNFKTTKNLIRPRARFLKKGLNQLWRFKKSEHTKEGLRTIFFFLKSDNFVRNFTDYIAREMQNHARQHYFLNFIQQSLKLFNKYPFCTPKNIIIQVCGRFNGTPRAKCRLIKVGDLIPTQSLKTGVHYAESTSFSKDGTFGIKVWVCPQNFKNMWRKVPRKVKFRKVKKGQLKRFKYNANRLVFGVLGLKALNSGILNTKQIDAARQTITRKTKRKIKIWITIFTDLPITNKPTGVRMGKGKGSFSHWGARVRGGATLFEVCGASFKTLVPALKACGSKLPIKTKIFN